MTPYRAAQLARAKEAANEDSAPSLALASPTTSGTRIVPIATYLAELDASEEGLGAGASPAPTPLASRTRLVPIAEYLGSAALGADLAADTPSVAFVPLEAPAPRFAFEKLAAAAGGPNRVSLAAATHQYARGIADEQERTAFLRTIEHPENRSGLLAAYQSGQEGTYFDASWRGIKKRIAGAFRTNKDKKARDERRYQERRAREKEGEEGSDDGDMKAPVPAASNSWLADRNANATALAQQLAASSSSEGAAEGFDAGVGATLKAWMKKGKHAVGGKTADEAIALEPYVAASASADGLKMRLAAVLDARKGAAPISGDKALWENATTSRRAVMATLALAGDGALGYSTPLTDAPVMAAGPLHAKADGPLAELSDYAVWEFDMQPYGDRLTLGKFMQSTGGRLRTGKTVELRLGDAFPRLKLRPVHTLAADDRSSAAAKATVWVSSGQALTSAELKKYARQVKKGKTLAWKPPVLFRFDRNDRGAGPEARALATIYVLAPRADLEADGALSDRMAALGGDVVQSFATLVVGAIRTPAAQTALETTLTALAQRRYITAAEKTRGHALGPVLAAALAVHMMPLASRSLTAADRTTLDATLPSGAPVPSSADLDRVETTLQSLGDACVAAVDAGASHAALGEQVARALSDATAAQPAYTASVVSQILHANAARVISHQDGLSRVALLWEQGVDALDAAF